MTGKMGIGVADTFSERGCPRTILLSDGVVLTVTSVCPLGSRESSDQAAMAS